MAKIKGCVDAGHGGSDRANRGSNGYIEPDGVLQISKYLKIELERTGQFDILLTRDKDMTLSLTERGRIASNFGADFFISEHTNATGSVKKASGTDVYYSVDILSDKQFAENLSNAISETLGIPNRGAKTRESEKYKGEDYYTVIDTAQDLGIPHVFIIESAFHDNPSDEALLLKDENLKKIAVAQAKVICDFYKIQYIEEKKEEIKVILPTLKLGSKSDDVKLLQTKLKALNYVITVDGDFGVKTETIVKQFQLDNKLVSDGIVGKNTWNALEVAKPIVKLTPILDTPISKYEITKTKDGINIIKIKKPSLKNIDVLLCNQPKETLKNLYKRLIIKPTFLINGGLFAMNNGNSMSSMFDEGKKIVSGYFSDFGLYVKKDGSYGFDNFNNVKDIKDFIGASPTLIVNGVKNIDLKGLTKDKSFTDSRHPRTCLGMDKDYFYLIVIDGRQLGKKGMTVNELVDYGLKMKLQFMINLDGGGSSMLLDINGREVNVATENRAIDNAIAFYL